MVRLHLLIGHSQHKVNENYNQDMETDSAEDSLQNVVYSWFCELIQVYEVTGLQ